MQQLLSNKQEESFFEEILDFEYEMILKYGQKNIYESTKRFLDIVLCLCALIVAIPIIMITCLFVIAESKGNPIYKQERCGKLGVKFDVYKIRSMYIDAEKNGPKWAEKNDDRVTKVGAFIRKTRIDELPQIFNILKGDMSIVGPRPERSHFINEFSKNIPNFKERLYVTPGLTGYAQVNGGYDISPKKKLEYDLIYIRERNLIMDIKIILKTVLIVFNGDGAR